VLGPIAIPERIEQILDRIVWMEVDE